MARNPKIDLWFEDECHFQQHGSRCAMWVPPEDIDPVVLHAPTRKSIGIFGAVNNSNGHFVTSLEAKFTAMTFLVFLKQLLRHRRKNRLMVVVVDNARWHHAKAIAPWLKNNRNRIRLDFLPPYSPELNQIERVWKLTRRFCTHNRYFKEIKELVDVVVAQFCLWSKANSMLRRLCAII